MIGALFGSFGLLAGVGGAAASFVYLPPGFKQAGIAAAVAIGVGTASFGAGWQHGFDSADAKRKTEIAAINDANSKLVAKARNDADAKARADIAAAQEEAAKDAAVEREANAQLQAALSVLGKAPKAERDRKAPAFLVCAARGDCK
ncbi:hypothetical protein [Methylosinus sp. PW1]|uniref:hypothetical protein n=1 Tax=Methylosinus sp. PW1 TaxID=107636 RepID=UPI000564448D|nr:hypothetical protein [Methylosinus sp. PW1]